jgi:DNA-binding NarL/FixJ family response regulator
MIVNAKILIVEDSDSKLDSIRVSLAKVFPAVIIRQAHSVKSAIDALNDELPDMIIADMSLPTYDIEDRERGGTPRPFGGIEVFEYLDRYDLSVPVLVVTSYESLTDGNQSLGLKELSVRLGTEFPKCFRGTVYFDSAYSTWEREITTFLQKILKD